MKNKTNRQIIREQDVALTCYSIVSAEFARKCMALWEGELGYRDFIDHCVRKVDAELCLYIENVTVGDKMAAKEFSYEIGEHLAMSLEEVK